MSIFDEMNKIKGDFESVISKLCNYTEENTAINIIIDGSDPQNPFFVDIENDKGESICIGEELVTDDGFRKIRINTADIIGHEKT